MTEDEQEAKSFRYVMPRVARLSSGRFALFTGQSLNRLQIVDGHTLLSNIPSLEEIDAQIEAARASRPRPKNPGKLTSLNLADLGL